MECEITKMIRVYGIVQGVGFRPTVSRHAMARGIRGSVSNKGPYVEIFAQGRQQDVDGFIGDIENRPPKRAAILKLLVEPVEEPEEFTQFDIIESEKTKGEIFVSPDIAICDECKEEMFDPKNRRYLHPFINCTCCGPRLTILDSLPYDRERTSMKEFPMCPSCADEYHNPDTRRYDAQPVCCNDCGPEVYLIGREERGREAITYTRKTIASGGIVAIKGIGGFHLCCDATSEEAVQRLRKLKRRPVKPFAVMAQDLETVKEVCQVSEEQEKILTGHQKPILLLDKLINQPNKQETEGKLCESIAPGNPKVGVMLPYAPVQLLLFHYDDGIEMPKLLVMTSGNTSGAPICRDDHEAVEELSYLCDCILSHDRKIRIRADDSVMDFYKGEPYMIRRSRGYAPLPFMVSTPWKGQVIAAGGELKNTFCIGVDNRFYPSPYVGDLEDLRTVKALKETIGRLETLLEVQPEVVVCDLHPKYNSTVVAEELGLPVLKVQHHYAHILSCMAENDCEEKVIGVSFDGTGYGTDGTIWGGEILMADHQGFTRIGSIEPFVQVGGDVSAKEGWRIAVSLIWQNTGNIEKTLDTVQKLGLCTEQEAKVLVTMAQRKLNAVTSTSAGRLFDGVSAILGIRRASTFEGEASTALEFAAEAWRAQEIQKKNVDIRVKSLKMWMTEKKDIPENPGTSASSTEERKFVLNTGDIVAHLVQEKLAGEDSGKLAYEFHRALAEQILAACEAAEQETGIKKVALSGGVFQNRLLLELVDDGLAERGFEVLKHSLIPPNDGGIALGQAAYGMAYVNRRK
ncbi:carbamoyltransferase HypF [Blautia sp. MSJ-36]|uniref:carbamoyltransferase HypF n=1 Tax=Blautia sp. MSJ-36 TaxID=2841530 RepID=UPI001C0F4DC9|nr:carbamoyltransferase HypF [Blautia sp. MSJ-36]MBU5446620.1 carbamoyltransferase HypF [Blautia sp. MSJ-36]